VFSENFNAKITQNTNFMFHKVV